MVLGRGVGIFFLLALYFCSTQAVAMVPKLCRVAILAEALPAEPVRKYLQENSLSVDPFEETEHHLWDNWGVWDPKYKIFHRYSQTAPTTLGLTSEDKSAHNEAGIRHFISADGDIWYHVGVSLEKKNSGELAYWSGKTLIHDGQYYLFHTRSESTGWNQHIALSISNDGHHFSPSVPILNPVSHFNYVFDDSDGAIAAWRDPDVFWNPDAHCWTMIFATKVRHNGRVQPGFGLATSVDLLHWNLLPGLVADVPDPLRYEGLQLELPNVVVHDEGIRLYASFSIPRTASLPNRVGALYWDVEKLGMPLTAPALLMEDPQYYGLSAMGAQGILFLFSTDRHRQPYRLASVPAPVFENRVFGTYAGGSP